MEALIFGLLLIVESTPSAESGVGTATDSKVILCTLQERAATRGTALRDPKGLADFTLAERLDLQFKHQDLIRRLQRGDVLAPSGSVSTELLGELTVATGGEVGLARVGGQRILRLGGPDSINLSDATRVIGHTHPSGDLRLSGALGGEVGDIPAFRAFQPRQRSSVLVGPDGRAVQLPIPR